MDMKTNDIFNKMHEYYKTRMVDRSVKDIFEEGETWNPKKNLSNLINTAKIASTRIWKSLKIRVTNALRRR